MFIFAGLFKGRAFRRQQKNFRRGNQIVKIFVSGVDNAPEG